MNLKTLLLIVGLIAGGVVGWMTAPTPVDVQIGPVSVEVQGGQGGGTLTATGGQGGGVQVQVGQAGPLDDSNSRTAIFALIGAVAGFAIGFVADRRKV